MKTLKIREKGADNLIAVYLQNHSYFSCYKILELFCTKTTLRRYFLYGTMFATLGQSKAKI